MGESGDRRPSPAELTGEEAAAAAIMDAMAESMRTTFVTEPNPPYFAKNVTDCRYMQSGADISLQIPVIDADGTPTFELNYRKFVTAGGERIEVSKLVDQRNQAAVAQYPDKQAPVDAADIEYLETRQQVLAEALKESET